MRAVTKRLGQFMQDLALRKTPLAEVTGERGGYLVPQDLSLAWEERWIETGVFRALARNVPMKSKEAQVPSLDLTATHAVGASPLFGGLQIVWDAENASIPASEPNFAGGLLVANDLMAVVTASNQLVEDGGEALGSFLEAAFAAAVGWTVERACFLGVPKGPKGVIGSPATLTVTPGPVSQDKLAEMVGALLPGSFPNAIWAASPTAIVEIAKLGGFSFFQYKDALPRLCGFIFGRPLYATEHLPASGAGSVLLFDPTMYVLGTRGYEVAASKHARFLTNQTVYRIWWRGDGQPIPRGTALLQDGVTAAAAFVSIGAAA